MNSQGVSGTCLNLLFSLVIFEMRVASERCYHDCYWKRRKVERRIEKKPAKRTPQLSVNQTRKLFGKNGVIQMEFAGRLIRNQIATSFRDTDELKVLLSGIQTLGCYDVFWDREIKCIPESPENSS